MALNNRVCKSIEDRDKAIKNRDEYGHWEMDTVVSGKGGKGALLVLTERMTGEEEIYKIDAKSIKEVCTCLDSIEISVGLSAFKEKYKTTCDNGVEFLDSEWIETSIGTTSPRTQLYYCHPYCSSERESIQTWMNNYPRAIFGGLSANDLLQAQEIK